MADALNERGWFWWGDVNVPRNQFAPEGFVVGTLTVSDAGRISIELDDVMPTEDGPFAAFSQGALPPERTIAGRLKSDNRYILATNLIRAGGRWSSSGISYDRYVAQTCLVSRKRLPAIPRVRAVDFNLSGFEEWLGLDLFKITTTRRSVGLRYSVKPQARYRGTLGGLALTRGLTSESHGSYGARGLDLREVNTLRFTPPRSVDVPDAVEAYAQMRDFLVLLTNSEYQADWPSFALTAGQHECKAYFQVNRSTAEPPTFFSCIAPFQQIKDQLGELFFSWLARRSALGPGVFLYLATRRGMNIYVEQKFANLVSGLEALHRSLTGNSVSTAFERKMERILGDIQDERDKTWLRKRTRGFGAPSLEQRLIEVLRPVPAGIEAKRLKVFCATFAKLRNEFAHGGHPDSGPNSAITLQAVADMNEVLSRLYHARILMEIGLPSPMIDHWLNNSVEAGATKSFMVRAGLKPASVLQPKGAF